MTEWDLLITSVGNEVIDFLNYVPEPPPEVLRIEDL